jgi:hypothetical protein
MCDQIEEGMRKNQSKHRLIFPIYRLFSCSHCQIVLNSSARQTKLKDDMCG